MAFALALAPTLSLSCTHSLSLLLPHFLANVWQIRAMLTCISMCIRVADTGDACDCAQHGAPSAIRLDEARPHASDPMTSCHSSTPPRPAKCAPQIPSRIRLVWRLCHGGDAPGESSTDPIPEPRLASDCLGKAAAPALETVLDLTGDRLHHNTYDFRMIRLLDTLD